MLKNYFKLAIKVLGRRKFFTFISLFGISFTLMILMLITAFLDNELGPNAPLSEKDRMVFMPRIKMTLEVKDTIPLVDSTLVDGIMRYDTTYDYSNRNSSTSISSYSYSFLDKYMRKVDGASVESIYSPGSSFDVFINNNKLTLSAIYTDAPYWSVYDFEMLEGRTYQPQQVANQAQVAVITDKTARGFFGKSVNVLGEMIELDGKNYEVIGVVKAPTINKRFVNADVFIPLTNLNARNLSDESFFGGFEGAYLASDVSKVNRVKSDLVRKASLITLPNPEEFNTLTVMPMDYKERYARSIYYRGDDPKKSARIVFGSLIGLLLLFVLLPTLNLVNVNISRIIERSSEIGVRKAFGAHSGTILFQFVFENIILTFLGGIIGFILALVLIQVINDSGALGDAILRFNFRIFLYSFLICLFFGILSGLIPAYRMSKMQIAKALKQNQL